MNKQLTQSQQLLNIQVQRLADTLAEIERITIDLPVNEMTKEESDESFFCDFFGELQEDIENTPRQLTTAEAYVIRCSPKYLRQEFFQEVGHLVD
ncbi:hypothetical protein ACMXYQ_05190 [Neptuniibacter sp. PT34_22]|uniref:hypothetical protein n=1 Tax=Neptuniibacter sp. PT34_22 TaxID=3398205 RepID=UPI0039F59997